MKGILCVMALVAVLFVSVQYAETSLVPVVYGEKLDLENTIVKGQTSTDGKLFLQFGENHEQELYSKTKITPILEEGVIDLCHKSYSLDNTEVRILGQSFRIMVLEDDYNILIYGKNLGDGNYRVNVYIYEIDADRVKFTFDAKLEKL